jgi:hypothetical protein
MTTDTARASRAPHVADIIRREQRRKMEYCSDYPLLVWVRRYPTYYARLGWREAAKGGYVERIKR